MASGIKFLLTVLSFTFIGVKSRTIRTTLSFGNQDLGYPDGVVNGGLHFPFYDGGRKWEGGWPGFYRTSDGHWFNGPEWVGNPFGWSFRYGVGYMPGNRGGGQYWWNAGRNPQSGGSTWADSTSTGNSFGSGFGYSYGGGKYSSTSSSSGGGQSYDRRNEGHEVKDEVATKFEATYRDENGSKLGKNGDDHSSSTP